MIRILMSGCSGRMGKVIAELAADDPEVTIAAGVDVFGESGAFPVFRTFAGVDVETDVIVDFSSPKAFDDMMAFAREKKLPVVLCTTGLSEEQIGSLEEIVKEIPVLRSANMSLGVNLLLKLVKDAARALAPAGFDIEIVERHHNRKKDAPSGTALALADSINESLGGSRTYVYDRSGRLQERDKAEIGISAVRGGTIPGTHEVIFAGTDEVIELNHIAYSRSIFGKGALIAAKYLAGKTPGLYTMADAISQP